MPITETSFRDRQGRAQVLEGAIALFTPLFAPVDPSLNAANFQVLINSAITANLNVENTVIAYTNAAQARINTIKAIRDATTQALNYVKANKAWVNQTKSVKMAADKLRGVSIPTKVETPPPPPPGTPAPTPEKPRNKGDQAYVELAAHLGTLITSLGACTGYAPPDPAITIATFTANLATFNAQNLTVANTSVLLTNARETRRILFFEGPTCFHKRFLAVKTAVKGQYGQNSAQYGTVKGIKW